MCENCDRAKVDFMNISTKLHSDYKEAEAKELKKTYIIFKNCKEPPKVCEKCGQEL